MTKILKKKTDMRSLKFLFLYLIAGCFIYSCDLVNADSVLVEHVANDDIYYKKVFVYDTIHVIKIEKKYITLIDTVWVIKIIQGDTVYVPEYHTIYVEVPKYDTIFVNVPKIIYIEVPGECPLKMEVISARLAGGHFYKKYRLSPASAGSGCNKPYVRMSFFEDQGFIVPTETFVTFLNGFYLQGNGLTNIKGTLNGSMDFEVKIHCPSGDEVIRMTIDTDGGGHIDDVSLLIW